MFPVYYNESVLFLVVHIDVIPAYISFRLYFCFFKQKPAYERRIRDWSSDVCSSNLLDHVDALAAGYHPGPHRGIARDLTLRRRPADLPRPARHLLGPAGNGQLGGRDDWRPLGRHWRCRYPVREPERRPAGPTVRHGHGLQQIGREHV